jgi:RND family efflux transporter MFP subunit
MHKPIDGSTDLAGRMFALTLLLCLPVAACSGKPEKSAAAKASELPLVTVVVPGRSAVETRVAVTGTLSARDELPISVEGEGARIVAVLVEVGDRVKRGQVLARLNNAVVAPQVASLVASLEEARTSADLAAADYRRAQGVASTGALSSEEIERRRAQSANAAARVKVAAAQLAEARARLGRSEIRAPADGVVLTRNAEVGQTASAGGEPLFRLGRGGEIEMRGRVSEGDVGLLAVGQAASVQVTGLREPVAGSVRLLGAVIDPATRLGTVRIALPRNPNLRPGAFARAQVLVSTEQKPIVPQTAVQTDFEGNYVLVVGNGGAVARRGVTISGTRNNGVVVATGLEGTEQVVAVAAAFLRPGEKVRVATGA